MGQQRQTEKPLEVSDSDSDFNPSYNELKNVFIEMHGDVPNAFKKSVSQKRTILKLEAKILKLRKILNFSKRSMRL